MDVPTWEVTDVIVVDDRKLGVNCNKRRFFADGAYEVLDQTVSDDPLMSVEGKNCSSMPNYLRLED